MMSLKQKWFILTMASFVIFSLCGSLYAIEGPSYENLKHRPEQLLETGETVIGQPLKYPSDGAPKITALIITVAPGEKTKVHQHPVPLFCYVISGELEVEYDGKGTKRFAPGDAFMEAMDLWHKGRNAGDVPARLLVVYMGSDQLPNVIPK